MSSLRTIRVSLLERRSCRGEFGFGGVCGGERGRRGVGGLAVEREKSGQEPLRSCFQHQAKDALRLVLLDVLVREESSIGGAGHEHPADDQHAREDAKGDRISLRQSGQTLLERRDVTLVSCSSTCLPKPMVFTFKRKEASMVARPPMFGSFGPP
eukprot:scaffold4396_cov196-Pinguiococcus_pyrenoidosus.AAC.6